MVNRLVVNAAGIVCLLLAKTSFAWTVFDPRNFVENLLQAVEAVKAEGTRVAQFEELYQQKIMAMRNLKSLPDSVIQEQTGQMMAQYEDLRRYAGVVSSLYGNVSTLKDEMAQRYSEQRLSGMSWEAFMKNEAARVARGSAEAVSRAERNRRTIEHMNRDFEQVKRWQEQIGGLEGEKQSMQLMNAQMNKLVSQNAQFISMMAASEIDTANAQHTKAAAREAAAQHRSELKDVQDRQDAKLRSDMARLRAKSGS